MGKYEKIKEFSGVVGKNNISAVIDLVDGDFSKYFVYQLQSDCDKSVRE